MIPYIIVPPIHLGPITLQPFGLLVATGILIGTALASRRARQLGANPNEFQSFLTWIMVVGFVFAHVLDALLYHPRQVWDRPWSLLMLWDGIGSFSGFFGAIVGAFCWKYFRRVPTDSSGSLFRLPRFERRSAPEQIIPMADIVLSVFPIAWAFGRSGCAVVHDHPGQLSHSVFSVAYGPGPISDFALFSIKYGTSPRFDLGLLELIFTLALAAAFALSWRYSKAKGWYIVATSLLYAPVRFAFDFLRVSDFEGGDPRYAGLTPGQWACLLLFAFGLNMIWYLNRRQNLSQNLAGKTT